MKLSRRAKRIQRHYRRMHKAGGLNLVSLMDIFTILVFFLMVNSSDVKVLQQDKSVELPKSSAQAEPKETLLVSVTQNSILVQGRPVAEIGPDYEGELIPGLKQELDYQAQRQGNDPQAAEGYQVTLVADKNLPYKVLKAIMATCTAANYSRVSLAVNKQTAGKGESTQPLSTSAKES